MIRRLVAAPLGQPGEEIYRRSGAIERRRYRPVQACSAREARRSLIRVRPEVRSSIGACRATPPQLGSAVLGSCSLVDESETVRSLVLLVRNTGNRANKSMPSPCSARAQTLARASCLWPRSGRGPEPTLMVGLASAGWCVGRCALRRRAITSLPAGRAASGPHRVTTLQ